MRGIQWCQRDPQFGFGDLQSRAAGEGGLASSAEKEAAATEQQYHNHDNEESFRRHA
jgi:hypothetical protein